MSGGHAVPALFCRGVRSLWPDFPDDFVRKKSSQAFASRKSKDMHLQKKQQAAEARGTADSLKDRRTPVHPGRKSQTLGPLGCRKDSSPKKAKRSGGNSGAAGGAESIGGNDVNAAVAAGHLFFGISVITHLAVRWKEAGKSRSADAAGDAVRGLKLTAHPAADGRLFLLKNVRAAKFLHREGIPRRDDGVL